MNRTLSSPATLACALLLGAAVHASAQDRVPALQDLVGARGSSGESALKQRGYTYVGGEKSADSSYTYWRESRSNRCVSVRTANGELASIVYTLDADCDRVGSSNSGSSSSSGSGEDRSFDTVCGVIVDGTTHTYRCHLRKEGCQGEGYCRATLTFPDNEMQITFHQNDRIEVSIQGLQPVKTTASGRQGQTRFEMDGKTYFWYNNPDRAKRELAKLP